MQSALLVLPALAAHKVFRGNKALSGHKGLPVQEVRWDLRARKVQSDRKVPKAKQEPRGPQVPQASAERREYRDHLDLQDLLVLQALRDRWVLRVNPVHGPVRLEPSRVPNR